MADEIKKVGEIEEIDLTKIDWNSLDIDEFTALEEKLAERDRQLKADKAKERTKALSKRVPVNIRGNTYALPTSLIENIKLLSPGPDKDKLLDEIVANNTPIIEI
jgi:hypothetical protein